MKTSVEEILEEAERLENIISLKLYSCKFVLIRG
jgi:hypothetical protein